VFTLFFYYAPAAHRHLHSFPTRRSSDLARRTRPLTTGDNEFERILDQLADPGSALSRIWDEEHDRHVLHRLLELIEPEFEPATRSEEHTSELRSLAYLVCRLLLEKKKKK